MNCKNNRRIHGRIIYSNALINNLLFNYSLLISLCLCWVLKVDHLSHHTYVSHDLQTAGVALSAGESAGSKWSVCYGAWRCDRPICQASCLFSHKVCRGTWRGTRRKLLAVGRVARQQATPKSLMRCTLFLFSAYSVSLAPLARYGLPHHPTYDSMTNHSNDRSGINPVLDASPPGIFTFAPPWPWFLEVCQNLPASSPGC